MERLRALLMSGRPVITTGLVEPGFGGAVLGGGGRIRSTAGLHLVGNALETGTAITRAVGNTAIAFIAKRLFAR